MKMIKAFFFLFLTASSYALAEPPQTVTEEIYAVFKKFRPAYETIQDYSATFYKEELTRGKWQKEVMEFHFKKPFKVKIKWEKGPRHGREVVFVDEGKDSKIQVKIGGLLGVIVPRLSLDPDDDMARDESNHTIREAGLGYMLENIAKVTDEAYSNGDLQLNLLEKGPVSKIERILPSGKNYPNLRLIVFVDETLGIPVGLERYDASGKLLGRYYYDELKTNQGLSDDVFRL